MAISRSSMIWSMRMPCSCHGRGALRIAAESCSSASSVARPTSPLSARNRAGLGRSGNILRSSSAQSCAPRGSVAVRDRSGRGRFGFSFAVLASGPWCGTRPALSLRQHHRCGALREQRLVRGLGRPAIGVREPDERRCPPSIGEHPGRRETMGEARPDVDLRRRTDDLQRDRSSGRRGMSPGHFRIEGSRSPMKGVHVEVKVARLPIALLWRPLVVL
jgi:hypothetical protein